MARNEKTKTVARETGADAYTAAVRFGPRVRVELVREPGPYDEKTISGPADVYDFLREESAKWDRERFLTLILDTKNRVVGIDEVSVGSLQASLVHPREVMKALILANAAGFICVHNHPSGDPTPSAEDIRVTRRLKQAGEIFGIPCLDHIVIGHGRFVSLQESGQL